ncbi:MAG: prephenate dehydrogenase [Clostridia bacterium]|nr:prephenate dehydrogenase [Clostridia bacterium]
MKLDKTKKILIVGLGLIGGSYAEALTDAGYEVGALDLNESSIDYALEHGMIAHGRSSVDADYVLEFDVLVFALYPHTFVEWIENYQSYIKPGAVITDVTGVKCSIVYKIQEVLRDDVEYIGAHPMAGREVYGVENAKKEIFLGANYIVTPTSRNTEEAIVLAEELGSVIGFGSISRLSPEEHDEMIGFLSQLTHCIAVSLMTCKESESLVRYTGDSFRDLTRIAKINENMWTELFFANRETLLREMDLFAEKFLALRDSIAREDAEAVRETMRLSTTRRKFFDK